MKVQGRVEEWDSLKMIIMYLRNYGGQLRQTFFL